MQAGRRKALRDYLEAMALIACPECGQNISSRTPACPHCGISIDPRRTKVDYVTGERIGMQPRAAVHEARPPLRYPSTAGMLLMTVGSALVMLGSFMPWVRLGPISISGMEGDGKITVVIGLIMLILGVTSRTAPSNVPRAIVMAGAIVAVAVALTDTNRLVEGGINRRLIGIGLFAILVGGLMALVGSFLRDR